MMLYERKTVKGTGTNEILSMMMYERNTVKGTGTDENILSMMMYERKTVKEGLPTMTSVS